jgi:hypothetical protein
VMRMHRSPPSLWRRCRTAEASLTAEGSADYLQHLRFPARHPMRQSCFIS